MEPESTLVDKMDFSNELCEVKNEMESRERKMKKSKRKALIKIKEEFKEYNKKQLFRKQWLTLPEFKDWLSEDLYLDKGYCTACNTSITAGKSELQSHGRSKRHLRNMKILSERNEDALDDDITAIVDDTGGTHFLRIIDLRSDSLSIPPKEMRTAMIEQGGEYESFDTNKSTKELEELLKSMLEKEAVLLFPTHVMANFVAVLTHCQARGSALFAGKESDIYRNNMEAIVKFGGVNLCPIEEKQDGTFCLDTLEEEIKKLNLSPPLSCVVSFECPHTRKGGVTPSLQWIEQLGNLASTHNFFLHCDGTRLINASLAKEIPLLNFVKQCDSVMMSFDKSFAAPAGAILAGKKSFIKRAAFHRKLVGGDVHQAGFYAASGLFAIKHMTAHIKYDHEKAKSIAIAVSRENSSTITVDLHSIQTNVLLLQCRTNYLNAHQLKDRLASVNEMESESGGGENTIVLGEAVNETNFILMLHNKISQRDVRAIITKLSYIIQEYSNINFKP